MKESCYTTVEKDDEGNLYVLLPDEILESAGIAKNSKVNVELSIDGDKAPKEVTGASNEHCIVITSAED